MVKVEMMRDEVKGIISFRIQGSREEDLATIDALRVAIMGDHLKRGSYENSNTLLIDINENVTKAKT